MKDSKEENYEQYFFFKIFQKYAIIPVVFGICFHVFFYFLGSILIKYFDFFLTAVILPFDSYIPSISLFIIPYSFYYPYLGVGPFFISSVDKKTFYEYTTALMIGSFLGCLCFILYPTYVNREPIVCKNIFDVFLVFVHSADVHGNACPSFHCFVSWLIYIYIRKLDNVKIRVKFLFFVLSFLICVSTVFTKQHGIIDIFGGVFLAYISVGITKITGSCEVFFMHMNDTIVGFFKKKYKKNKIQCADEEIRTLKSCDIRS